MTYVCISSVSLFSNTLFSHSLPLVYIYSTYPLLSIFLPLLSTSFTSSNFLFKPVLFSIGVT